MTKEAVLGSGRPEVSVIMVTFGGRKWVAEALAALDEHTDPGFELIVVDNGSTDGTADWLKGKVPPKNLFLNGRNRGFAAACNQGASRALGRYLCFLNPDALVEPGWLPPLVERLTHDSAVACVVPRLTDLDGTLQEAGSLVGREGATWSLGRGSASEDLEYAFPLDVDFGSGACMLVRRAAFVEVGGFDVAYWPAYVEDVDLCLSFTERGYRVVYEPGSVVRHVRAGMTDVSRADAMIRRNRGILLRKWAARLSERPWLQEPAYFPHRITAVRDANILDRILLAVDRLSDEDDHGDPVNEALRRLTRSYLHARVTVAVADGRGGGHRGSLLAREGIEVILPPRDWDLWFESRRHQVSAVLAGTHKFDGFLDRTQPQAPRADLPGPSGPDLITVLAQMGVAPPTNVP